MTPAQWKALAGTVAERMKTYTRPFVTPIRTSNDYTVWLLGTGSYVAAKERRIVVTAEHVIRGVKEVHHQFWGCDDVFICEPFVFHVPLDTAFAPVLNATWNARPHNAVTIDINTFAPKHNPVPDELLFFRGFAGENAKYGFGIHQAHATGYCSQEPHTAPPAPELFEMIWNPDKTEFTPETSDETKAAMKHDDPHGFSGSLVWNTRFVEKSAKGEVWTPEDAVVTGLVQRWMEERGTIVALRVEYLTQWLDSNV